jgi:hypothetical protein
MGCESKRDKIMAKINAINADSLRTAPSRVKLGGELGLYGPVRCSRTWTPLSDYVRHGGSCRHSSATSTVGCAAQRLLLGAKRIWRGLVSMSANDPKDIWKGGSRFDPTPDVHVGWLREEVCSLEPSQKSSNQRYAQEQEKGFQNPHSPRVIVHPIVHQSPHLGPP